MAPLRGDKKKRKVENKDDNNNNNNNNNGNKSFVSGFAEEGSAEWWNVLSKKIAGNPRSSILEKFKSNFQMSRKTFDYICSLVKDHMITKAHYTFLNGKPMSLADQVAVALSRLGSGNSLISVGESFGTHHSTVSQVTWRFVEAIEEKGIHHIQWPSTEEMTQIKRKFEKLYGFPNCCGAIDTTHVKMLLTSSDQEADTWLDRNKNHSMILQVIVDPDLRFRDIITGWPGKMSESLVLQSSNFFKLCQEGEKLKGPMENTDMREYIIGDSGFPLLPWLITPYKGKELSVTKAEFNKRLLDTHDVASKALTRLKEIWKMIGGDMWRPDKHKLPRIILVCCILHNIGIDMGDGVLYGTNGSLCHDQGYNQEVCEFVDKAGLVLRKSLSMYVSGRNQ